MEDYDNFVQRRLSHLRRSEEEEEERHRRPSPAISLICIHGRPILPPLLSGEQREEMQRHRDVAQKAAGRKKLKDDPRMSYVQTILNSVPLSTPTLEELLRETEIDIKSSCSQNTSGGSASESHLLIETTMDSLSLSPPLVRKREDGLSPPPPPLASIVSSAFLIYNVTPQESYNEGCLADQHDGQQGPQPSSPNGGIPKSVSSGYATCENTVFVPPAMIDAGSRSCGLGSSEGTYSWDDFFLQSTSHTITKMPEIISHPAVDGEALERGLELSLCNNFTTEHDMCCTSFQDDSATSDNSATEASESSRRVESTESGDNIQSTGKHDLDRDHISDRNENPENSGFSDNPELSDTLSTRCNSAAQLLTKHEPTEPAGRSVDEATPSEDPYRMSLQALLKKSQEYRQQQWMLRNQAKNTKVQKRNQEPNRRTEEQSLSDKENDESPCKVTVTPDGKNTGMIESEFTGKITDVKSESKHLTGDSNTKEVTRVEEEETIHKNNKLNSSQEVLIELEEISSIIEHQPVATEVSPVKEAFNLPIEQSNLCLGDIFQGVGRIYTIPAPNFCTSPVPSKSRVTIENGEPVNGAESSEKMHEGQSFEHERNRGHQNTHTAVPCERAKQTGTAKEGLASRYGWHGSSRRLPPPAKCIWAAAQRMRIPDVFRNIPSEIVVPCNAAVLSDTSNHPAERSNEASLEGHDSSQLPSLNQSYDVDTPSELWLLDGSGSDSGSNGDLFQGNLTPESTDEGQGRLSKVKRRLLMHTTEETQGRSADTDRGGGHVVRLSCSTPRAAALRCEGLGSQKKQEQLKRVYTAQIRALRDEHRRQQEELQQALAARYSLLQSVSFSCSPSASRLGDTMTFSTLSQPSSSLSVRYCHLLSAAVKGYLARRLLRTERVAQLVRTIRDTQQFLFAFQLQNPNRGDLLGRQDLLLQKRVALQLRAARYEVYDIFFILSARERMQLISWDRNLTRERALRQQSGGTVPARRKSFLSAATEKALERKKGVVTPKKAVERHSEVRKKTGHRNGFSTKQPREAKRGQFRANPLRVPKSAYSTRPR